METISSVEQYWMRIADKAGDPRKWNDLTLNQQNAVIWSINILMQVINGDIQ